ncbi:MAG TPA: hypothetical protein VLT83_06920 [Opitutaceae bacterium]|nr:hypothetical protein [Opitutaceae bacterium]
MAPRNPSPVPHRRRRREAGSVILLVLMTLLLTAGALTKYLEKTTIDLLADAREVRSERLRVEAYSALETVLAVLQEFRTVDGTLRSPAEGWGTPLEFAGYVPPAGLTVGVTLEDESGKISLPHADFPTLRDLFLVLGQKQTDAERLADALLVWMQPGYEPVDSFSARATDYERAAIPHDPPARSLHSFGELAAIRFVRDRLYDEKGNPNDLWRRFVDSVSLYDFAQPNVNGAVDTTLGVLGGYDDTGVRSITDYLSGLGSYARQGPAYFRNPQDVAGVAGQAANIARLGAQVACLRVNVTVHEGPSAFRLSAVIAPPNGAGAPPADPPPATTDSSTTPGAAASTASTATTAASPTSPTPNPDATSSTAQPALNYPFTLLEIRENDEIVGTVPSSQPTSE